METLSAVHAHAALLRVQFSTDHSIDKWHDACILDKGKENNAEHRINLSFVFRIKAKLLFVGW